MEAGLLELTAMFIPPAPTPRSEPLGPIALLRTLKINPLEVWTQAHFEQPIVIGGLSISRVVVVSDPAAIRRVLLENSANYRKDWMQRRILSAGLANGLLSAEGNRWKTQRRALAPLFSRKTVLAFSAAMVDWRTLWSSGSPDIKIRSSTLRSKRPGPLSTFWNAPLPGFCKKESARGDFRCLAEALRRHRSASATRSPESIVDARNSAYHGLRRRPLPRPIQKNARR